ncbi:hypothetical protein K3208_004029 [Escherichia coli]|uniref:hypothetical protein n=1 Tax=Escherichia coli TaxID=562 RepID=UPI0003EF3918|nr:hypothetical protein [Escherichia coli]EEU2272513.1 hypothetical protein [Escherichia coli]EFI9730879.1 hypothetical protein [Escherichia coli]EFN9942388.1 hypothetical protein [Escherichia coli]EGO4216370.1 hypothetical protein [Escherichia coli]EHW2661655.1 hypothetical protein [Escherichia coli]
MSDTSHKESKWHPHLDMSFLGCVLAFSMEVYFEEHIFIPHGGGASFGLIALIVINFMTIPIVIVVTTLFCYLFEISRKRVNRILIFLLACILTIIGLFIAYPVGQ